MAAALRTAVIAALILSAPLAALAQTGGWRLSLGIPFDAHFRTDPQTPTPAPATFPTGLRAAALTPFHLGFGLAAYRTGFDSALFPYAGRSVTATLAEVQAVWSVEEFRFGLGVGLGRARFRPVSASASGLTQEYLDSPAREGFLLTAYRLDARWEAELGLHLLHVDVRFTTDGAPAQGGLDARLLTAGVGFRF